jgi:hypothetical protein
MYSKMRHKRRSFIILLVTVFVVISCLIAAIIWASKTTAPDPVNYEVSIPKIESVSSKTLFLGNIYWGRYINDWSMASDLKYAYPFSRLNEFNREEYDAWISTLECPSIYGVNITSQEEDSTLTFNCSPDYLPEASKWFDILSLSSNHAKDRGLRGFEETKANLEANNIQYFGSHTPDIIEDACEVVALPVTVIYNDDVENEGKLPIAMCGYQGVFQIPPPAAINEITKYSEFLPTFAMPHMGAEYVPKPDQIKISTYRAMVDAGADMVIGDHPHVIQTSEVYNGVPIIYSMGNFIFDQQDQLEVTRSAGVKVFMEISNQDSNILEKWLDIGESCSAFKDNCLNIIKEQGLKKLDVQYGIGIIGANNVNKIVKPATEAELKSILERLNWSETVKNLQPPYSEL